MSAAEPLVEDERQPPASTVLAPVRRARRAPTRRELAWALLVSAVLTVGIVGTLLFQTAMQGQARTLLREHEQAAALSLHDRTLHHDLARAADPAILAARARALHMRPQVTPHFLPLRRHHAERIRHGRPLRPRREGSAGRAN